LIRRYGCSSTSFTLEAGRKCDSGPGVFTFETNCSKQIFTIIQQMTTAMKQNASEESSPPSLPSRNYTGPQENSDGQAPKQSKGLKKLFGGLRGKKQETPAAEKRESTTNPYEMPSDVPPPPPSEHVYHVYGFGSGENAPSSEQSHLYDDAGAYEDSGGNSMSELAAAAIMQEQGMAANNDYDSLDLSNIPVVHAPRSSKGVKHLYCELPVNEKEKGPEEVVYDEVNR
jgi:hypothetical protein